MRPTLAIFARSTFHSTPALLGLIFIASALGAETPTFVGNTLIMRISASSEATKEDLEYYAANFYEIKLKEDGRGIMLIHNKDSGNTEEEIIPIPIYWSLAGKKLCFQNSDKGDMGCFQYDAQQKFGEAWPVNDMNDPNRDQSMDAMEFVLTKGQRPNQLDALVKILK